MSRTPTPESPTPEDAAAPARRRIRVADGQLQREETQPGLPPPAVGVPPTTFRNEAGPGGGERQSMSLRVGLPTATPVIETPSGPSPSAHLPAEITGFFRHLHDTAQALSQHIGMLTVGIPGQTSATEGEARPLPMHQRRPQRVEAARVNAKRSTRFSSPLDSPPRSPSAPVADGEGELLEEEATRPAAGSANASSTDVSAFADPSVPLSAAVHDLSSGPALTPFRPRQGYAPSEDSWTRPYGGQRRWGLALTTFVLGLLGSWVLFRLTASAPARPPGGANAKPAAVKPGVGNPAAAARATGLVTQALRAEKGGDLSRAADLFTEAEKACPDFPGIRYRQALLALRRGEKNKTRTLLGRSLESGEEVAAVHNLQSALARLENQPQLGFAELEAATRAEPFNPKYFYFWAEALRRAGRLPEAAEKMEEALARTTDPTDESLYQLKLRLIKVDLNREAEFAEDLAARLQDKSVAPAEWLLTAAALDLKHGEYPQAAARIERARQLLVPATANFLLNDQTFRDNAWRPELAPFYAGPLMTTTAPVRPAATPIPAPPATVAPTPAATTPKTPSAPAVTRPQPTPPALPTPTPVPAIKFRTGS